MNNDPPDSTIYFELVCEHNELSTLSKQENRNLKLTK